MKKFMNTEFRMAAKQIQSMPGIGCHLELKKVCQLVEDKNERKEGEHICCFHGLTWEED
jgi:hypothetical protein